MAGKFEVYEDKSGKFRFRLKASNGQVIATGEADESKASAAKGHRIGPQQRRRRHGRRPNLTCPDAAGLLAVTVAAQVAAHVARRGVMRPPATTRAAT